MDLTEKLDYSSGVALLGFTLILAILRAFNVRDEAARVMIAAPLMAFVTTHILYLNFYKLDYGNPSSNILHLLNLCSIVHHYTKLPAQLHLVMEYCLEYDMCQHSTDSSIIYQKKKKRAQTLLSGPQFCVVPNYFSWICVCLRLAVQTSFGTFLYLWPFLLCLF